MTLLIGTRDGVYRTAELPFDELTRVLDCGRATHVSRFEGVDGVFAATRTGLYRSPDGGRSWTDLGVPETEVWGVLATPDGTLYAGTYPARLYRSSDGGDSWTELDGLQYEPSRARWLCPNDEREGRVRAIASDPADPDRLVVGVEVGRLHVSDDRGETWWEHRDGVVQDDIHQVLVLGPGEYVVACGMLGLDGRYGDAGLYRTADGGDSWTRLDTDFMGHPYVREAFHHGDTLYFSGARTAPEGGWDGPRGAEAALFESGDRGDSFTEVPYPGGPQEFVLSWTARDGRVLAGTGAVSEGHVLERDGDGWRRVGRVSGEVKSLQGC